MKVITTFWSKEYHEFKELFYIQGNTDDILFKTDLSDIFSTYLFFKAISQFVKSSTCLKTINSDDYYQFAVIHNDKICPIVWFDLEITDKLIISHDHAFQTTLIKKNGLYLPLGHFPSWYYYRNENVKLPKYREFHIKSRAYKFIANQVKTLF